MPHRHLSLPFIERSQTSTRLHDIARELFSLKPVNEHVDVKQLLQSFGPNEMMDKIERFFESFGDLLIELTLNFLHSDLTCEQAVFHLITKYCNGGALEAIRFHEVTLETPHSDEMLWLFGRLKIIELDSCSMVDDALSISKGCQQLTLTLCREEKRDKLSTILQIVTFQNWYRFI